MPILRTKKGWMSPSVSPRMWSEQKEVVQVFAEYFGETMVETDLYELAYNKLTFRLMLRESMNETIAFLERHGVDTKETIIGLKELLEKEK